MDEMTTTKPWESKTLWVSVISIVVLFVQAHTQYVVTPEIQGYALVGVNMLLRFVTKDPISWN